jgi:DNA-binding winged helix-turn-helix (wHTH) protein/TolB-like protein/Flp pilus assembly protein TadD
MSEPEPQFFDFADLRVDVGRRVLLRGRDSVPLTPRVFDTLLFLVRHHGRVIEKDELMRAIWPDAFVEENNLNQNISTLRRALGENRGENRYIATVPGRGYRFVAEVTRIHDSAAGSADADVPAAADAVDLRTANPPVRTRSDSRVHPSRIALGVVAVVVGIFVLAWAISPRFLSRTPSLPSEAVRTMAVLPFKAVVVEHSDESLELGIADSLIATLSSLSGLTVSPLSAVRGFGKPDQDPLAAGRALGVEAVLDGTILKTDNRIRITTRLMRVSDGKQLWADHFEDGITDIFAVQESISDRVTKELALELTGRERELFAKRYTNDAQAYELYLRGRFLLTATQGESTRKAIGFFQDAIRRDPGYALAYAWLATSYRVLPISADVPPRLAFPQATAAALNALRLDGRLAEAHSSLGWIKLWSDWDWQASEKEFRRALEINPNEPVALLGYAHLLSDTNRDQEALTFAERAIQGDPISAYAGTLKAHFLFQARRYPEAIAALGRTLELQPTYWIGQITLGKALIETRECDKAIAAFQKAREFSGGVSEPISLIGYTYAVCGHKDDAAQALRDLEAISADKYVPPHYFALVYQGLGESAEALRWLERAYEEKDVHLVFLGRDPKWDSLRGDLRFASLMQRLQLPQGAPRHGS